MRNANFENCLETPKNCLLIDLVRNESDDVWPKPAETHLITDDNDQSFKNGTNETKEIYSLLFGWNAKDADLKKYDSTERSNITNAFVRR